MERRCKRGLTGPLLLSLALLAGCGVKDDTVPADWYGVGDIYAYMKAVQDEEGKVTTTVELRNGASSDADYLYLRDDEYLFSTLDTPPKQYLNFSDDLFGNSLDVSQQLKVMSERNLNHDYLLFVDVIWGKPEYYSHAHPDGAAAKRAYVVFQRHDNDQLVGESSVAFPAPFQIQAPAAEATLSRAVPLELTWSDVEPGSVMEFDVAGICSDDSRYTLHRFLGADSGSYTLHSADYFPTDQIEASQSCRVAIMLQRIKMEEVSSQFAFGNFKGVQLRTVEFTSTP